MSTETKHDIEWPETEEEFIKTRNAKILNYPVSELEFSPRTEKRLRLAKVNTVQNLASMTKSELLALDGFGRKSLREVNEMLARLEIDGQPLKLREDLPPIKRQPQDAMCETSALPSWQDICRAKIKILKSYKSFIEAVRELGDLLKWRADWLVNKMIASKSSDKMSTTYIRNFFTLEEQGMRDRLLELKKEYAAQTKKKELIAKYNLSDDDVALLLEALKK